LIEYRFVLTYLGTDTTIVEPKNWDSFESELDRDFKAHGATFKYTSGTLKLGFAGSGRTVFESAFQTDGMDAAVTLTIDSRPDPYTAWTNIFIGDAIMQNREYSQDFFEVDFEESGFKQKLKNRLKTKVKLDTTIDLDGNALTGSLTSYTNQWDTIRFYKPWNASINVTQSQENYDSLTRSVTTVSGGTVSNYAEFNWPNVIQSELETAQSMPASGIIASIPGIIFIPNLTGDFVFNTKFHFYANIFIQSSNAGDTVDSSLKIRLRHLDSSNVLVADYTLLQLDSTGESGGAEDYDYVLQTHDLTQSISSFAAGDKLGFFVEMIANNPLNLGTIDVDFTFNIYYDSTIEFKILEGSESVTVKYWLIFDVVKRIVQILTGQANSLSSSFLQLTEQGALTDGCGGLNMITNGYQLRGIDNPLELSLQDCLDHIIAEYGAGWGFKNVYGNYTLMVELMEFFYQDTEILDLGSPLQIEEGDSYSESSFDPLLVNNIKVGYKKFSSDEDIQNNVQDFLTESEYQTPVASIDGSYNQISPFIASGRLIQATFEARLTINKAWKYDENVFIVAAVRSASTFIPENDENFSTVTGIDNPATAYNLRKAPVQMFLNHALLVNSACFGKAISEVIQNVSAKVSKNFSQQYISYALCKLGDDQNLVRTSTGNITIENNFSGQFLWRPIQHTFTVALTGAQYDSIVTSMEGNNSNSSLDHGFIKYRDNEGNTKTGFPMNIKRSPVKSIATVTTLEKLYSIKAHDFGHQQSSHS
jgi:hypothetical protein